ncbi:ABC transporter permease subunit [Micropruina sp.]|uniref:ABC transporter permease subunit n=1 Tax=Micropruina sp. TaxID=2737536 RepID=UPI0039E2E2CD
MVGVRIGLGSSWATVVAAELIAAQSGLGFRMQQAQLYYDLPTIFVSLIAIGVLGLRHGPHSHGARSVAYVLAGAAMTTENLLPATFPRHFAIAGQSGFSALDRFQSRYRGR